MTSEKKYCYKDSAFESSLRPGCEFHKGDLQGPQASPD